MKNKQKSRASPDARLLEQVRGVLRYRHDAYLAELAYCQRISCSGVRRRRLVLESGVRKAVKPAVSRRAPATF